MVTITNEFTYS